jgi:hypothetical protein
MIKQAFQSAEVKKPLIAAALIRYKQAEDKKTDTGGDDKGFIGKTTDSIKEFGSDALAAGKRYGPGVGIGAGAGVIAGIPISLLANAVFGKDKSLRGYLRSALMGSLIGGGVGALGGAGLRYYGESSPERGAQIDAILESLGGYTNRGADLLGLGGINSKGLVGPPGPNDTTRVTDAVNYLKNIY